MKIYHTWMVWVGFSQVFVVPGTSQEDCQSFQHRPAKKTRSVKGKGCETEREKKTRDFEIRSNAFNAF